ncbi:hypothetical protein LguiA_003216 [Lonicera macranthoides]
MDKLIQGNAVFELRWRNNTSILGRIRGSRLLGRAEIPWKSVFESPDMKLEKWIVRGKGTVNVQPSSNVSEESTAMMWHGKKVSVYAFIASKKAIFEDPFLVLLDWNSLDADRCDWKQHKNSTEQQRNLSKLQPHLE